MSQRGTSSAAAARHPALALAPAHEMIWTRPVRADRFRFPMLLTAAHMIFGSVVLLPAMMLMDGYRGTHRANLRKDWKALLFIGAVNGPQIALNNASLVSIELSLNQVIRAGIPVCVACCAFCLERRVPTEIGAAYLLLVTLSVMCVMFTGKEHGELFGIAMCLTSVLMQSAQMSLSGKLMSGKLDSFQLNFYTGPIAFMVLVTMELCMQQVALTPCLHPPSPTLSLAVRACRRRRRGCGASTTTSRRRRSASCLAGAAWLSCTMWCSCSQCAPSRRLARPCWATSGRSGASACPNRPPHHPVRLPLLTTP